MQIALEAQNALQYVLFFSKYISSHVYIRIEKTGPLADPLFSARKRSGKLAVWQLTEPDCRIYAVGLEWSYLVLSLIVSFPLDLKFRESRSDYYANSCNNNKWPPHIIRCKLARSLPLFHQLNWRQNATAPNSSLRASSHQQPAVMSVGWRRWARCGLPAGSGSRVVSVIQGLKEKRLLPLCWAKWALRFTVPYANLMSEVCW